MKHVFHNIGKILIICAELCAFALTTLMTWYASHDVVNTVFTAAFCTAVIILHDVNVQMPWATKEEECD